MKSHEDTLRFADFTLDPANRRLWKGATPVELGGRYFDALVMLVRERGQLISKDRLHEEVWRGVPVTDEALSQAVMALRRALGDDAAQPRFIETVPRHGYRFIGETVDEAAPAAVSQSPTIAMPSHDERLRVIAGGISGAAVAGLVVGLAYGSLAASAGAGRALSLVLVLICVSVLAALVSGLGIAAGIAWLDRPKQTDWWRPIMGGLVGGVVVGGFAGLLGLDTLRLLTGSAPERMAGAGEGLVMGIATGIAWWLARRAIPPGAVRHAVASALGAIGGATIILLGGTLMAGSLAALVARFPGAGLTLAWVSEPLPLMLSGAFEGAVFTSLVIAGMRSARPR